MNKNETLNPNISDDISNDTRSFVDKILKVNSEFLKSNFQELQIEDYEYDPQEASDELGLDIDLVNQLVEDYVAQILKTKYQFLELLEELEETQNISRGCDYAPFRELAHKNLGVARNLRILDGIKVLDELMKKNDLYYLGLCIEALESCAIRLNPTHAFKTLKLINLKNTF
ncbi:MAG: hypothetical protein U9N33_08390 [Campylobacterota bacterium]|nr:hypothetical protein [Campylobacterota bacterium]